MPRTQEIDLGFVAADDYGIARASLHYRKNAEGDFIAAPVALGEQKSKKEVAVAYHWKLTGETLFPGNTIEYYVEVADNNIVTGPGVARSKTYRITMPTIGQLYDTARDEEQHRDETMKSAVADSKQLSEQLEKLSREYVKTEKMDWSQKKEFDKAMETQQAVQQKIDEAKRSLDETLQKLSENEMTSQQIGEKMEEIRNLMEQINSDELKKYMEQLKQAMEKLIARGDEAGAPESPGQHRRDAEEPGAHRQSSQAAAKRAEDGRAGAQEPGPDGEAGRPQRRNREGVLQGRPEDGRAGQEAAGTGEAGPGNARRHRQALQGDGRPAGQRRPDADVAGDAVEGQPAGGHAERVAEAFPAAEATGAAGPAGSAEEDDGPVQASREDAGQHGSERRPEDGDGPAEIREADARALVPPGEAGRPDEGSRQRERRPRRRRRRNPSPTSRPATCRPRRK